MKYFRIVKDGRGKIIEWESFRRRPRYQVKGDLVPMSDAAMIKELNQSVDKDGAERLSWDGKKITVDIALTEDVK